MTLPTRAARTQTVVYDLDGVITTRDSFTALLVEQLRRAPARLAGAVPATGAMLLSRREQTRRDAVARITALALSNLREEDYTSIAARFGARIGRDPAWIRESTVERIRRQRAGGATVVIATATERRLAQALLDRAGVPYDVLSASLLTATATGMRVSDHRVGTRKLEALREQGVAIEEAEFVTDSTTDLPTARAAARVTLIGASARTRRRYARAGFTVAHPAE